MGKGKGTGKGKGIVKRTPGADDISRAVALQLQEQMSEADLGKEGLLERVYLEPEASPAVSISFDDDTDSTQSDGEYDSELDPDVDMCMEDDVDGPDGVDLDGDVDMERDGENAEDEEEEDEKEEDEKEEEVVREDEDNSKEPRTIDQGEMVNTLADDADNMVDEQPTLLPEQGREMRKHTPRPQPPAPATQPHTPEPRQRPRTPDTHSLSGLEFLGLVTRQKPRPAAPTLREAEAAGNSLDVNVEQQLFGESAGGDSLSDVRLPDIRLPDIHLPDVPLPDVPLPDVPLHDVPLPQASPDGSVRFSPRVFVL
jgi:hypothetical protein